MHSIDRNLPLSAVNTMDKLVESSVGQRKLSMMLLGLFSLIAVVLASIGIYGVMSYSVTQRSRELGIRMALGAARSRVLALVVGQGMTLAVHRQSRSVSSRRSRSRGSSPLNSSRVGATDPVTFALVSALLVAVALLATLVPALRATRVDPVVALRDE